MEYEIQCPWCGEWISIWLDPGGGASQNYIEDCQVCCRPMQIDVVSGEDGELSAVAERAN